MSIVNQDYNIAEDYLRLMILAAGKVPGYLPGLNYMVAEKQYPLILYTHADLFRHLLHKIVIALNLSESYMNGPIILKIL